MTDEEIKDWYLSNIARLFDPAYGTPTIEVALERQRIFPRLLLCAIEGVPPQDNFDIEKKLSRRCRRPFVASDAMVRCARCRDDASAVCRG